MSPGNRTRRRTVQVLAALAVVAGPLGAYPLYRMFSFGLADHRQKADAAVVFGAAVWPGNQPSQALSDRMRTGIELYRQGLVPLLILSGGPSDEPDILHETVVMRGMALEAGVPDSAIVVDPDGVNTRGTVDSTVRMFRERGIREVLAVSHFYHLPRIDMAYRAAGFPVHTVPAQEEQVLLKLPYFLAREIAAYWVYWLRTS